VGIAGTTQSVAGLTKVELQLDGATVATATDLAAPTFQLITTAYPDGAHVLGIQATDVGGLVSVSTIHVTFANYAPIVNVSTPAANTWVKGSIGVAASVQSTVGLTTVELIVDGTIAASAANLTAPTFTINTANYTDGAHTIAVRATDVNSLVTTSALSIKIDNTPPTTTAVPSGFGTNVPTMSGCATDDGSGILSVTDVVYGTALSLTAQGCWASSHTLFGAGAITNYPIIVRDNGNSCSTYLWSVSAPTLWALTSSGPC
jgi:hypothetical protein